MSAADSKIAIQDAQNVVAQKVDVLAPFNSEKKILISDITRFLFNYGKRQSYNTGQFIIREGQEDKTVYIILSGEVEVLKRDANGFDKVVTTLHDGGVILGEMSVFLDEPRTTSVRVSKETMALEITGENFISAVVNIPELSMRMLKSLSNRLKVTNEKLIKLKGQAPKGDK